MIDTTLRILMIVSDFARAALIAVVPFAAHQSIALVYLVSVVMGTFSAWFYPSQIKMVAELAPHDRLVRANSYLSVAHDGGELMGYAVGAALVAALGYAWLSSWTRPATWSPRCSFSACRPGGGTRDRKPSALSGCSRGRPASFSSIWRNKTLRVNLLLAVVCLTVVMMNLPNAYALVLQVFGGNALGLMDLEVLTSCGLILGGLIFSQLVLKRDKNLYVFGSFLIMACCFIAVSVSHFFWASVGLIGLAAVANIGLMVPALILFQLLPDTGQKRADL